MWQVALRSKVRSVAVLSERRPRAVWGGHWSTLSSDSLSDVVHTGLKSPYSASYLSSFAEPTMSQQSIVLRSTLSPRLPHTTSYEATRLQQL